MGGHGGLNILPQKSWHVYNQDNREKVAADERAHEAEEALLRGKHKRAESEHRRQLLLARAQGAAPLPCHRFPEDTMKNTADEHVAACMTTVTAQPLAREPKLEHVNFWKSDELRAGNAEKQEELKNERRRRGDEKTQTSDARFDERFKLAHEFPGNGKAPWYAQRGSTLPREADSDLDGFRPGLKQLPPSLEPAEQEQPPTGKLRRDDRAKRKDKKRSKHGSNRKDGVQKASKSAKGNTAVERLREERHQREAAEKMRQQRLMQQPIQRTR